MSADRREPFLPAWLDDAGLDALVFRFLLHVHRRGREFFESAKMIAERIGGTAETARALRALAVRAGVLRPLSPGARGRGHVARFRVMPASSWDLSALAGGIQRRRRDEKRARRAPFSGDRKGRAEGLVKGRAEGLEKGAPETTKVLHEGSPWKVSDLDARIERRRQVCLENERRPEESTEAYLSRIEALVSGCGSFRAKEA